MFKNTYCYNPTSRYRGAATLRMDTGARGFVASSCSRSTARPTLAAAARKWSSCDSPLRNDATRRCWCASGRLYHELTTASRFGELGLVGSHVAHGLSERLDVRAGDDVRLEWRGASFPVAPVAFPTAEPPFVCS